MSLTIVRISSRESLARFIFCLMSSSEAGLGASQTSTSAPSAIARAQWIGP